VKEGMAGNIVYSIAQSPDGVLWFGTDQGLTRYDGTSWKQYRKQDGLLDNNVYSIAIAPNGDVWVGTKNGVARMAKRDGAKR
jgi:ligand-binding sensor domain-containing protein